MPKNKEHTQTFITDSTFKFLKTTFKLLKNTSIYTCNNQALENVLYLCGTPLVVNNMRRLKIPINQSLESLYRGKVTDIFSFHTKETILLFLLLMGTESSRNGWQKALGGCYFNRFYSGKCNWAVEKERC